MSEMKYLVPLISYLDTFIKCTYALLVAYVGTFYYIDLIECDVRLVTYAIIGFIPT